MFPVLISNYINGHFLIEAIESLRNQTHSNWEIILVVDASTDDSKELSRQLEDDALHSQPFTIWKLGDMAFTAVKSRVKAI